MSELGNKIKQLQQLWHYYGLVYFFECIFLWSHLIKFMFVRKNYTTCLIGLGRRYHISLQIAQCIGGIKKNRIVFGKTDSSSLEMHFANPFSGSMPETALSVRF